MDPEDISPQDQAAAAAYTFQGKPIAPFSVRRQYAAQALGNRLLCGTAELTEGGSYPGMFLDVVTVLYLCVCPKIDIMLALRKPDAIREKALTWAEEQDIRLGSDDFKDACAIYAGILGDLQGSQFEVIEDAKKNTPTDQPESPAAEASSSSSPSSPPPADAPATSSSGTCQ